MNGALLVVSSKDLANQDAFLAFSLKIMHARKSSKAMFDVLHVVAATQQKIVYFVMGETKFRGLLEKHS